MGSNQAARDQSPVPYQLGEGAMRWRHVRASNPRFRCERPVSWPVGRTWQCWSGRRELNSRLLLGRQRLCHLSYARLADGAGVEPARPEGLDALAPRFLAARPTIRYVKARGALGVNRTPNLPFRRRPLSSVELRGQCCAASNPGGLDESGQRGWI